MAARKRFGGRPKRQPEPGERVHLGFRVTPQLKRKLEEASAANGRSQSQEAEMRLEQSFGHQELLPQVLALAYGRQLAALLLMLGEMLRRGNWLESPYGFDQSVKGVNFLLKALRPPGEIVLPPMAFEKGPPGTPPFQIYSQLGEIEAERLLSEAAGGTPLISDHALVIHQMLGRTLVDRIKQYWRPLPKPEGSK
jgi:TraY domain